MAARIRKGTKTVPMPDSWRQKIRLTEIMNRVQSCAFGELEMTPEQLKAAQMILSKVVPDLARQEHTGLDGEAIKTETKITNAGDTILAFIEEYKPNEKP